MRQDVLKRTLEGLEDDLDALREDVADQLERFDAEVVERVEALPEWLELTPRHIRGVLRLDEHHAFPNAVLGPWLIAEVASEVEAFLVAWVGEGGEPAKPNLGNDPAMVLAYQEEHADIHALLDQVAADADEVTRDARALFNVWREDILNELEEQRLQDSEALESLVAEGELHAGRNARQELAQLWEDQRRRANALMRQWARVEALVLEGATMTREGLEELRGLLEQTHQGLSLAHEALSRSGASLPEPSDPARPVPELRLIPTEEVSLLADDDFDPYGASSGGMLEEIDEPSSDTEPFFDGGIFMPQTDDFAPFEPFANLQSGALEPLTMFDDEKTSEDVVTDGLISDGPMIDFFADDDDATSAFYVAQAARDAEPLDGPPDTQMEYDVFQNVDPSTLTMRLDEDYLSGAPLDDEPIPEPEPAPEPARPPVLAPPPERARMARMRIVPNEEDEDAVPATDPDLEVDEVPSHTIPVDLHEDLVDEEVEAELDDAEGLPTQPMVEESEVEEVVEDTGTPTAPLIDTHAGARVDALDEESIPEEEEPLRPHPSTPEARPPSALSEEEHPEDVSEGKDQATRPGPIPCVRTRRGLAPVGTTEFVVAFVTPIALAMGVLAYAWLAGPLSRTAPGMWLAYAALAWLAIAPLALRWRMAWRGTSFAVVRRVRLEDHTELVCADGSIQIGPWTYADARLTEVSRARWSSHPDGREGACLQLVWGSTMHVFSAEGGELWGDEGLPSEAEPMRAWRIEPGDLDALHAHAQRTLVDIGRAAH